MMVLLHSREGATPYQEEWIQNFKKKITEKCALFCINNAGKIDKPTLKKDGLKAECFGESFDHIKYPKIKDDDGKSTLEIDTSSSPSLSIKMIERFPKDDEKKMNGDEKKMNGDEKKVEEKKEGEILNTFFKYDATIADRIANGDVRAEFEIIDAEKLILQRMKVKFDLKIESIFVGKTVLSIQIKLYRACISPIESKMHRVFKVGYRKQIKDKSEEDEVQVVNIPTDDTEIQEDTN